MRLHTLVSCLEDGIVVCLVPLDLLSELLLLVAVGLPQVGHTLQLTVQDTELLLLHHTIITATSNTVSKNR